ncbi:MAG: DHA2 family efflux MFS transporter permease subunit [Acidobacteria bacterium]|nr:DHA2 family efflux MFS transporter permease subunit [Acidobacteriota bacterium]
MSGSRTAVGPNKWIVAALVSMGIFITLLDTTIVDIVLPHMMASLDADIYGIQWVVIIYFLGSAISMTAAGWVAEVLGHRNTFLAGVVLFISMSAMAGSAPSLAVMLTARFFQGVAEGIIIPVALVILYESFPPEEQGLAMGLFGMSASFAPALGPTIGGLITQHLEWRWVFFINVPIGILTIVAVWWLFRNTRAAERPPRFDFIGFALLATAFAALIVFTGKGQEKGWLSSDFIFHMLLLFIVATVAAVLWFALARNPLFPRRILASRPFRLGLLSMVLLSINAYGFFLLLPVFLEKIHGYTTLQAGLIMFPGAMISGFVTLGAGALADRISPKWIAAFFLLATAVASWYFHTDINVSRGQLVLDFVFFGAAMGAVFAPVTLISLGTLEERDIPDGSTLVNVVRLIAGSVGSAFATAILSMREDAFYEGMTANLTQGGARGAELMARMKELTGGVGHVFNPDAWHVFLATAHGLMLRRAASYAFHAAYGYLGLFSIAAAVAILLVRAKVRKIAGPVH